MSNHILASGHHATRTASERATANSARELVDAFLSMIESGKRPRSLKYKMADAARGRPINPLGTYPSVAEECLEAGASPVDVERPLRVMLAHIQRRFRNTRLSLRDALTLARKEQSEADISELSLALSASCPEVSVLRSTVKELRESIIADEQLAECIEARLYGADR